MGDGPAVRGLPSATCILLLALAPAAAWAQDAEAPGAEASEPETPAAESDAPAVLSASDAAQLAFTVTEELCSRTPTQETEEVTSSMAEVVDAWDAVSRAYAADGASYLLFWRGVLGQCVGQRDRARDDLAAFVAESEGDVELRPQLNDAKRRLRVLSSLGVRGVRGSGLPPVVQVGVGGGWQMTLDPPKPFHTGWSASTRRCGWWVRCA